MGPTVTIPSFFNADEPSQVCALSERTCREVPPIQTSAYQQYCVVVREVVDGLYRDAQPDWESIDVARVIREAAWSRSKRDKYLNAWQSYLECYTLFADNPCGPVQTFVKSEGYSDWTKWPRLIMC